MRISWRTDIPASFGPQPRLSYHMCRLAYSSSLRQQKKKRTHCTVLLIIASSKEKCRPDSHNECSEHNEAPSTTNTFGPIGTKNTIDIIDLPCPYVLFRQSVQRAPRGTKITIPTHLAANNQTRLPSHNLSQYRALVPSAHDSNELVTSAPISPPRRLPASRPHPCRPLAAHPLTRPPAPPPTHGQGERCHRNQVRNRCFSSTRTYVCILAQVSRPSCDAINDS